MGGSPRPVVRYDVQLMAEDMVGLGLNNVRLAARARVSDMTVIRFLRGERQTAKTAKKLAEALGKKPGRYVVPADSTVGA